MRGMLRPERVKGKNMKKYSKIARIAAFALGSRDAVRLCGCSGKNNNNNKNNGGNNNGGSGENRTAPSNTPVPAPSTKTPQMNDDMKSLNELFVGIQAGTTPITGITVKQAIQIPTATLWSLMLQISLRSSRSFTTK